MSEERHLSVDPVGVGRNYLRPVHTNETYKVDIEALEERLWQWVDNNVTQAAHLHCLATEEGVFESATKPAMPAFCLHYKSKLLPTGRSQDLHFEVAARIENGGKFWFVVTIMKDKTRFCINPVNIYTTVAAIGSLYATLKQTCREVEAEMASVPA